MSEAMSLDFEGSYINRAALVIMHYQVAVFAILFGDQPVAAAGQVQ